MSKSDLNLHLEEKIVNRVKPRTVVKEGAFFLPYIAPGLNMLDVGCGSGSMAQGFARCLNPGKVIGIDIDPDQITHANNQAQQAKLANLTFRVADVFELPFADESFDLILAHNFFIHLADPVKALRELFRVCKNGGYIGLREGLGGFCYCSDFPLRPKFRDLNHFITEAGQLSEGSPAIGVQLKGLLRTVGFRNIVISNFSETYDQPMDLNLLKTWYQGLMQGWMGKLTIQAGIVSAQEIN